MQPTNDLGSNDSSHPKVENPTNVDHSYGLGYEGFVYTSRDLERGFTLRHLGVVLLTADHSPFVVCQRDQEEVVVNAAAIAPMVVRRLAARHVPLLSFNVFPSHKSFRSFVGIRRAGIVQLDRKLFSHLDEKLANLVNGSDDLLEVDSTFREVVQISANHLPSPSREDPRAAAMREFLEADPEASTEKMAAHFGMSERSMARRFGIAVGMSIRDYRDYVRGRALIGPLQSSTSLTEVALETGFGGSPQLSHAFRRWFDQSPSSMRDRRRVDMQLQDPRPATNKPRSRE